MKFNFDIKGENNVYSFNHLDNERLRNFYKNKFIMENKERITLSLPTDIITQLMISYKKIYLTLIHEGKRNLINFFDVLKILGITDALLREWKKNNLILCNKQNYHNTRNISFTYSRISNRGKKQSLNKRSNYFQQFFPRHFLIEDIGSSIKNKKGITTILRQSIARDLHEVITIYNNKLYRFNINVFDFLTGMKYFDYKELILQGEVVGYFLPTIVVYEFDK